MSQGQVCLRSRSPGNNSAVVVVPWDFTKEGPHNTLVCEGGDTGGEALTGWGPSARRWGALDLTALQRVPEMRRGSGAFATPQ